MLKSVSDTDATFAYTGQIKWANMLRPDYYRKGRDLPGVFFPAIFIKDVWGVTKEEVLLSLKRMKAKVAYSTLDRYVTDGNVEKPTTKSLGRVVGKVSQFPTRALFEAYATWCMLQGKIKFHKEDIHLAREEQKLKYRFRFERREDYPSQVWVFRAVMGYLMWKYEELLEPLQSIGAGIEMQTCKWVTELCIDDKSDEIPLRMLKAWREDVFKPTYLVRETPEFIRVYIKKNDQWEMISKDNIADILNMK